MGKFLSTEDDELHLAVHALVRQTYILIESIPKITSFWYSAV
jgi:hypothetical protein